jgi:hypothetical protein
LLTECLFVVRDPAGEASARERAGRAAAWFGKPADVRWYEPLKLAAGRLGGAPAADRMSWGENAAFSYADGHAQLVAGPDGPLALYAAGEAYATHAVVAALLAGLPVEFDPAGIAQLFAFGHTADQCSHLRGVRPVDPGTTVDWPGAERGGGGWGPAGDLETALLESLALRVPRDAWLGLTGGADSRLIAVSLKELGLPFKTFTWGAPGARDVDEAARVAKVLGVEHLSLHDGWHDPKDAPGIARAEARLHDGLGDYPRRGRDRSRLLLPAHRRGSRESHPRAARPRVAPRG